MFKTHALCVFCFIGEMVNSLTICLVGLPVSDNWCGRKYTYFNGEYVSTFVFFESKTNITSVNTDCTIIVFFKYNACSCFNFWWILVQANSGSLYSPTFTIVTGLVPIYCLRPIRTEMLRPRSQDWDRWQAPVTPYSPEIARIPRFFLPR